MKTTHVVGLFSAMFLVASAAASGCSDDETTTTGTGTTTRSTTTGTTTTGTTTTTTSTMSGGGDGGMGAGGMNAGGGSQAQAFCMDYETPCGFGQDGRFASLNDCVTAFEAATAACQDCWVTHLANAGSDPDSVHCSHACGIQGSPGACADCGNSCM